jgi:hypothetical protein
VRTRARTGFVALLAVLAVGCPSLKGTCEIDSSAPAGYTYCVRYTGVDWTLNAVMSDCVRSAGTFSATDCEAGDAGSCTFNGGTQTETMQVYSPGPDAGDLDFRDVCQAASGFYAM